LNIGVSRNRFCDFLADPDSRSFSRFGAIIMQVAVLPPSRPLSYLHTHFEFVRFEFESSGELSTASLKLDSK
jgi:hypothetical protein